MELDLDLVRPGVAHDVVEGLLRDPEARGLDLGGRLDRVVGREPAAEAALLRLPVDVPAQRGDQARGRRAATAAARRRGPARGGSPGRPPRCSPGSGRDGRGAGAPSNRLEVHLDGREGLPDVVVQLAGDALTLGLLGADQPAGELLELLARAQELLVIAVLGAASARRRGAAPGARPPGPLSSASRRRPPMSSTSAMQRRFDHKGNTDGRGKRIRSGSRKRKGPGFRRGPKRLFRFSESADQYIPPMPPGIPPPADGFSFSLISETRASVVSISPATDAAF